MPYILQVKLALNNAGSVVFKLNKYVKDVYDITMKITVGQNDGTISWFLSCRDGGNDLRLCYAI